MEPPPKLQLAHTNKFSQLHGQPYGQLRYRRSRLGSPPATKANVSWHCGWPPALLQPLSQPLPPLKEERLSLLFPNSCGPRLESIPEPYAHATH